MLQKANATQAMLILGLWRAWIKSKGIAKDTFSPEILWEMFFKENEVAIKKVIR